jgi:phytoene dehydrogenase-like protein
MLRFAWRGLRSAVSLARSRFSGEEARALFAGLAAHSILPLERRVSAAVGLVFAISAHAVDWPIARGGSRAITEALASLLRSLGGEIECGRRITALDQLPESRVVLLDTSPDQLLAIAGDRLPGRYRRKLEKFRFGPGVFKLDYVLSGPIPWSAPACAEASTVHVGGDLDEIAASEAAMFAGEIAERPYLIVCQQSHFDDSRTPDGTHTGYAYCHVPAGCDVDMTGRVEAQIERFAPGFADVVLERYKTGPAELAAANSNLVGGAITGGVGDLGQLFSRPAGMFRPYATPDPRVFLCSASTPPGGGVHGMCGHHAARAALRRLR